MGRRPKLQTMADGSADLRVVIGPQLWGLVRDHAERVGLQPPEALRMLLVSLEADLELGQLDALPAEWRVTAARRQGAPKIPDGFDFSRLHRSTKTKSGFAGVYANGRGFRAAGRNGEHIAQCDTAEEAAYRRLMYYRQRGLPYGPMEDAIDNLRKIGTRGTDEQLKALVLHDAQFDGTAHLYEEIENQPQQLQQPQMFGFGEGFDPSKLGS